MKKQISKAVQPKNTDRVLPRLQFYICFTKRVAETNDPFSDLKDLLPAHLDWVADQEKKGHLFMAGPFRDSEYWQGDGMLIFKTQTAEQAEKIAKTCPFHKTGKRTFEIVPWQFNEGSLTLTIKQTTESVNWE